MSTETEKVKLIKTMTEQGTKANNKSNDRDSQRDKLCIKNQVSFTDTNSGKHKIIRDVACLNSDQFSGCPDPFSGKSSNDVVNKDFKCNKKSLHRDHKPSPLDETTVEKIDSAGGSDDKSRKIHDKVELEKNYDHSLAKSSSANRCVGCKVEMMTLYIKHRVENTGIFKCKKCSRNKKPTTEHICDYCGELTHSRKEFVNHVERHRNYTCDACKTVLRFRLEFKRHLRTHFEFSVCDQCGLKFDNPLKFKNHVTAHDPNHVRKGRIWPGNFGTFNCNFCPKVFDKLVSRNSHQKLIHKDGSSEANFKCKHCPQQFYSREDLRMHDFTHYKGKIVHCDFPGCEMFFKGKKHLSIHVLSHYPPQFECSKCGNKFSQKTGLKKHLKWNRCLFQKQYDQNSAEAQEKNRLAEVAKTQFDSVFASTMYERTLRLKNHPVDVKKQSDEKSKEEADVLFDISNVKTSAIENEGSPNDFFTVIIKEEPLDDWQGKMLREDVKIEVLEDDQFSSMNSFVPDIKISKTPRKPFQTPLNSTNVLQPAISTLTCDYCGKQIEGKLNLRRHFRTQHENLFKVKCFSGKLLRNEKILFAHQLSVHGIKATLCNEPEKPFSCDLCGFRFKSFSLVKFHIQVVHCCLHNFPCDECEKTFKFKGNLNKHKLVKHSNVAKFICDVCGKAFKLNSVLNAHAATHEKNYECTICGKKVSSIEKHMLCHVTQRRIVYVNCDECGKKFSKETLNAHINSVHLKVFNGKHYRCDVCFKDFTRREELRLHKITSHDSTGKLFRCQLCPQIFNKRKNFTNHLRVHNPKNVKCETCGNSYLHKAALRKHTKKFHPEIDI